jgi:ribosome-binding protein aMBF1 (putative translation factor)
MENIKCDLCDKEMPYTDKITMVNKINKNIIDICEECFNYFFGKSNQRIKK